ncbi:MAG TPA: hypothetical protein VMD30_05765, partial [Tepidisphaeraceae bacterium]|nr:hypothetical protein [Tepidisphaeraceae bacterium]
PQDLQVDKTFGQPGRFSIPGDFVVNPDATQEQLAASLGKIFSKIAGTPIRLVFRNVERPVIVFSGKWQQKRIAGVTPIPGRNPDAIEIYGLALNSNRSYSEGGDGPFSDFAGWLGEYIDKTVVFEATNLPRNPSWNENEQGDGTQESGKHAHDLDLVCRHICEQTGLTWSPGTRTVRTLFIEHGN